MKTGFCVMTTLSVGPEGNAPQEERGSREMTASFSVRGSLSAALLYARTATRVARVYLVEGFAPEKRSYLSCVLHPRFTIPRRISLVLFKWPKCVMLVSEGLEDSGSS